MLLLRKIHQNVGVFLALFIFLQVGSGMLMSLSDIFKNFSFEFIHQIHHGGGQIGSIYRIIVGTGLIFMLLSGVAFFIQTKKRMKKNLQ